MPVYCNSKKNEIWILVIEKSYAKMCGNYSFLDTLTPRVILKDFTGMPCFELNLNDISLSDLKKTLIDSQKAGFSKKFL